MHFRTAFVALTLSTAALAQEELAAVDKPAPTFRLPVYNGPAIGEPNAPMIGIDRYVGQDPTDKKTKLLVVSFMASFCGPCKKEMPYLQSLHEKYKEQGLRVLMVAIDREEDGQKKVAELVATNKVTFPVLKDRFNIVARRWLGTQSPLPSLFMVRPDGTVKTVHRGYGDDASTILEKEVSAALATK
ncbi:MAG: TlpA family protein disulfide reductase [Archangiaceae bacterium]|nr:TlpA family protein disulfide reductase [Archangiaceae bacterium]